MSRFLLLGAAVTALFKVTAPASLLDWFFGNVILSVILMMALAIVLSVCSEADAFIAASFSAFPPVSLLAFMGIGPMVDLKLIAMYGAVFKKRVVVENNALLDLYSIAAYLSVEPNHKTINTDQNFF